MDCRANGEVVFKGATTEFQLRKGLTPGFFFIQFSKSFFHRAKVLHEIKQVSMFFG